MVDVQPDDRPVPGSWTSRSTEIRRGDVHLARLTITFYRHRSSGIGTAFAPPLEPFCNPRSREWTMARITGTMTKVSQTLKAAAATVAQIAGDYCVQPITNAVGLNKKKPAKRRAKPATKAARKAGRKVAAAAEVAARKVSPRNRVGRR
jgi:hypothetical protein